MSKTTRKRLAILATATVLLAGSIVGVFQYRSHQESQRLLTARTEGLRLYTAGDYPAALGQLSTYVARNQTDRDALRAYGRSRALTPEHDGRHVLEGIGVLRRYLELAPDDHEIQALLLDLYTRAGYSNESLTLAQALLDRDPNDAPALRSKYLALGRLRQFPDARAACLAYLDLKPESLPAHWDYLDLLDASRAPADEALKHAEQFASRAGAGGGGEVGGGGDPRMLLLRSHAETYALRRAPAEEHLRAATTAVLARPELLTADFASRAVGLFDRLSLFAEGQRFIERAADARADDTELAQALAARLWASGRLDAAIARTDRVDLSPRGAVTGLLAVRALALFQSARSDDARAVVDALAKRDDDSLAVAWSRALTAAFLTPDLTALRRHETYQLSLSRAAGVNDGAGDPLSVAVFRHLLAGVSKDLGEPELAISHWQHAAAVMPDWPLPARLAAESLAAAGRFDEAKAAAASAFRRSPTVDNLVAYADAWARQLSSATGPGGAEDARRLLDLLTDARARTDNDPRLLPAYAIALTATGQRDAAASAVRTALADPALPPELKSRLAEVSDLASLGLDTESAGLSDSAPDRALSTALRRARAGEPIPALEDLKRLAGPNPTLSWQLALARFLDATASPDTVPALRALVTSRPAELSPHLLVLSSLTALRDDPELYTASIDTVRKLTGDSGITWRLARARYLLSPHARKQGGGGGGDRNSAEAVDLLTEVVRVAPRLVPPRALLAEALRSVGNTAGATDQLAAAFTLAPASPAVGLPLVELHRRSGNLAAARDVALTLARSPALTLGQRVDLADLLSTLNEPAAALDLLTRPLKPGEDDAAATGGRDAALARLYARQGQRDKAADLHRALLARPDVPPSVALDAAENFAAMKQLALARETLDTALAKVAPDVADTTRAVFEERHGDPDRAVSTLRDFVRREPRSAPAHRQLGALLLRLGRYDEAADAIATGVAAAPEDPALRDLATVRDAMLAVTGGSASVSGSAGGGNGGGVRSTQMGGRGRDVLFLLAFVSRDAGTPAASDTLTALRAGQYVLTDPATLTALRQTVSRHPQFLPARALLLQSLLATDRAREAAAVGGETFAALPTDPDAARLAAAAYLAAREPQSVLGVARRWRELTPDDPLAADLALAQANLALRNPDAALRALEPHLRSGTPSAQVHLLRCRALLATGRTDDAWTLASDLWRRAPNLRPALLAALTESADSTPGHNRSHVLGVLDRFALELAGSDAERFLVAHATFQLGARQNLPEALDRTASMLTDVERSGGVLPPAARLIWADALRRQGDPAAAEAQLRKLLAADPDSAVANNNLADLLLSTAGDDSARKAEAVALARAAAQRQPGLPDVHDTLARALAATGQTDAALTSFSAALRLAPDRLDTLLAYARLLATTDRPRDAADLLRRLEPLLPPDAPEDQRQLLQSLRSSAARASANP